MLKNGYTKKQVVIDMAIIIEKAIFCSHCHNWISSDHEKCWNMFLNSYECSKCYCGYGGQ